MCRSADNQSGRDHCLGTACADHIVVTSTKVREVYGGEGNDVIYVNGNVEIVDGGPGEDVIYGELPETETGSESLVEGETASASISRSHYRIRHHHWSHHKRGRQNATATVSTVCTENPCLGGDGGQTLEGGAGDDQIFGERGDDTIYGNGGNDSLFGGTGDDNVYGGEGNDLVVGGPGDDHMYGESGNDLLRGDSTIDQIYGGAGTDTLSFATGVTPGFTGAYPSSIKHVEGFPESESGEGRGVFVRLDGGATNCGLPACDNGASYGGGSDEIAVSEIENLIGSPFADIIVGSSAANKIYGGGGADVIVGGGGADELFGGAEGDYIEDSGAGAAYGGPGVDNCVNVGTASECEGSEARVAQHEVSTMSAGFMMTQSLPVGHDAVYLVGSTGNDEVNATYASGAVTFTSYGTTHFGGTSDGCTYESEGTVARCPIPEGKALDAVLMAGMGGDDKLSVGGGNFPLTTSPVLLGGEGNDALTGSGSTEDTLIDGNGTGNDVLKGYGYDDALNNNEGQDTLEGGNGNDLFLSVTTCDGDTLNGAEAGSGGDGPATNNASWAKLPSSLGGVTADLETQSSGNSWSETTKAPACTSGSLDHLYGMDDLEGSNQGDALFGNVNQNSLMGHNGQDFLHGNGGPDKLTIWQDGERDVAYGGSESECLVDRGVDEHPGCAIVNPSPIGTTTYSSVSETHDGQPGSVSVIGHVYANNESSLNGYYVNINFSKEENGSWVYKNTAQATINSNAYEVHNWSVGVGNWRVKAVFPAQHEGDFEASESAYHTFTINPSGYTTETFLSIKSVVNGQPGNVSVEGHVNVTTAEGGPINGLYVNVNFNKEEGGSWVYKNTAKPTIVNGHYEVNNWGVGVGNWRVRAVFPQQGYYLSSESAYHYFTVQK